MRSQLMQPVMVWERVWVQSEGSSLKLLKWVRTEQKAVRLVLNPHAHVWCSSFARVKQFDETDGDTLDAPLAPLPDEPDADGMLVDDDDETAEVEDGPELESAGISTPASDSRAQSELPVTPGPASRLAPPVARTPHPLSMSILADEDGLQPLPVDVDAVDPLGIEGDPLGIEGDPLGVVGDPLGVVGDPLGSVADSLGAVADHHLREDAPAFERMDTMTRVEIGEGDGILQNGMLVEDVVPLDVGEQ